VFDDVLVYTPPDVPRASEVVWAFEADFWYASAFATASTVVCVFEVGLLNVPPERANASLVVEVSAGKRTTDPPLETASIRVDVSEVVLVNVPPERATASAVVWLLESAAAIPRVTASRVVCVLLKPFRKVSMLARASETV
jgi:hypothetical protein